VSANSLNGLIPNGRAFQLQATAKWIYKWIYSKWIHKMKTIAEFSEFCIVSIPTLGLTEAQDASEHASHNSSHTPLHSFSLGGRARGSR
jgi:hypothetical protein